MDYLHAHAGGAGADETVVIRHGYLVWEGTAAGNVHEIYSATKTCTSTVLGLLVTDGVLSVDDPAVRFLPTLDDEYPDYGKVTLRRLATMTAGYDGAMGGGWSYYATDRRKHLEHVLLYTKPGRPLFEPGQAWKYHDPQVHMLGYLLTQVSGKSLEETFRERIAQPIGMKAFSWSDYGERDGMFFNNPAGTPGVNQKGENQGGVYSNALDLARYGLLYLNRGNWNGRQILDPSFVEQAGRNQVPAGFGSLGGGRYGFYWWTNGVRADGTRPWPQAPPQTYAAQGAGRNYIFVIPEWSMVIVRLSPAPGGFTSKDNMGKGIWEEFFARFKRAVVE
jgi:CubicO group peptidase (beta-lactamase class C family)